MGKRHRRTQPHDGLSYYDANSDRLITYGPDVLNVKREIETRWPELSCFFDTVDEVWVVVEHCADGTDRLVFDTPALSGESIERVERAKRNTDLSVDEYLKRIDSYNAQIERDHQRKIDDRLGDAGERLEHALRKDGIIHRPVVFMGNRG